MSVTRTFTVTVSNPGSGNKYYIDGVLTPTLNLGETGTYKFDQADSSNSSHPLRFATAADAAGGTEYTTGVTSSGTPGNAGAYTQIVVAASAPTLYYYCTNHSGMGGQANTISEDSYGALGWGSNLWGVKEAFTSGWGAETWGTGGSWGQATDEVVVLTGLSLTSSLGTPISGAQQGWGRDYWGKEPWGESYDPTVTLSGFGLTSALGTPTVTTEINTGWGQDGWGVENWGQSALTVIVDVESSGVATTGLPDTTWGAQGWGSSSDLGDVGVTWGGDFILNVADVMGVTGVSATSSIGSPTIILSPTVTLTAPSGLTSSIGAISLDNMVIGLTGLGLTSGIGAITPADVVGISSAGVGTTGVGELSVSDAQVFTPTGVGATSSVGSVITEVSYILTAPSTLTSGVGTITPSDVVGLEGLELTSSVGNVSPLGYFNIDITGNTNYNDIDITGNTSYTDVA